MGKCTGYYLNGQRYQADDKNPDLSGRMNEIRQRERTIARLMQDGLSRKEAEIKVGQIDVKHEKSPGYRPR